MGLSSSATTAPGLICSMPIICLGRFSGLHAEADFTGTGIGLATVQRVILRHHGRIWAEAAEGQGAIFYFELGV